MVKLKVNGIPVELPHQPYPSQIVTISQLLRCFQNGTSCLIESPTGTGKSLSIVCSVLAYNAFVLTDIQREDEDKRPYRVIICSRTHKQLEQLLGQLKKTVYCPRIAILGSRAQYCVNPRLQEIDDKNSACSDLLKNSKCPYFNGKDRLVKRVADRLLDIEELRSEGKRAMGCPYFVSRMLVRDADVILAPYNYMFDYKVREAVDVPLARSIVIIDEAHNVEDVCRMAGSLDITSQNVEFISNDLLGAVKKSAALGEVKGDFITLLEMFRRLREYAERTCRESAKQPEHGQERQPRPWTQAPAGNSSFVAASHLGYTNSGNSPFKGSKEQNHTLIRKGAEIVEELKVMGIKREELALTKSALRNVADKEESKDLLNVNTLRIIEDFVKVLEMIFEGYDAYSFCFQHMGGKYSLSLWLLDPGVVFRRFASSVWSISLLSGTLTPFASFSSELGFKFSHQVIAPHILKPEQVFVASVRCGHLSKPLCGTYSNADTTAYLEQIAHVVSDLADRMKEHGGVLVFVPSYAFLARLAEKVPGAVVEPRSGGTAEFERTLKRYNTHVQTRRRAVLLCVFRGKASEGTDFRDAYARAVVSVGIPYPSLKDPQVAVKKEYNDRKGKGFNGRMWYETQAYRAVNQALGRVVRHAGDWGALFLLDSRFSEKRYCTMLPQWVNQNMKHYEHYKDTQSALAGFLSARGAVEESTKNAG